ncbi:MAG TPA: FecR domain-containing protein [Caulobacteraceae bacterium]|nr:FecR domain-containing protein [Caulobacteraceae bacterium]
MSRRLTNKIDDIAVVWISKLERGLTEQEREELDEWLASDKRHFGAFCRMRAFAWHTERSAGLGAKYDPSNFRRGRFQPSRRMVVSGGASLAAGLAALGWYELLNGRYGTRLGEVRRIPLSDGTIATLNTDTTIAVHYSQQQRLVKLVKGEALFDVAKDPKRPFVVALSDLQARAVGTSFSARLRDNIAPSHVVVREGIVEVRQQEHPQAAPVRLAADMRAALGGGGLALSTLQSADVDRELAWQNGRISFDRETLAQAAEEFARYSDVRIIVDPALAHEEVSGLFPANDPVAFGQSVAQAFGAQVALGDKEVRLYR